MSEVKIWAEATKPFREATEKSRFTKIDLDLIIKLANKSKLTEEDVKIFNKKIKSLATKKFFESK